MIFETPISASRSSEAPWNSAGYSIAPTPMIVPWPCISRGTEWFVPSVPGLVKRDRGAGEVLAGQRPGAGLVHHRLVGRPELREVHRLAALDRHHHQRPLPVLAGQVDRQPQVHVVRGDHRRACRRRSAKCRFITGILGQRPHHREPDQVGEGDLPAAGAPQLVVDHQPVVGQQLRRHRPHADVAVGTSSDASMFFTTADAAPRNGVLVPSSADDAGRAACEVLPAAGFSGADRAGAAAFAAAVRRGRSRSAAFAAGAGCAVTDFVVAGLLRRGLLGDRLLRSRLLRRDGRLRTVARRSPRATCPRLPAGSRRRSRATPGRPQ